jgi:hypothetical protein
MRIEHWLKARKGTKRCYRFRKNADFLKIYDQEGFIMGGLHSGRKRQHVCIDDCLEIDLMDLNRMKRLRQSDIFTITWQKWRETNFRKRMIQEHQASVWLDLDRQTLTLRYRTCREDGSEHRHKHALTLESTPCNYGGKRWWFRAPCCQKRVRALYVNLKVNNVANMRPLCRDCQELHYASQCSSYIERHATYERYLLANYGYTWASIEYHALRHHYFEIDAEYQHKKEMSELSRQLEMLRLLIRSERIILKSRIRVLRKLSTEGRREYFEYLAADPQRAQDYLEYRELEASLIARSIIPSATDTETTEDLAYQEEEQPEIEVVSLQLAKWLEEKDGVEQELRELEESRAA